MSEYQDTFNSTKEKHVHLLKEMNTELNVAKQERSTFMQDVSKNNQEVQDSFCRSELANAQTFAELDIEVADLREQISRVANTTRVQSNNFTLCDTSQVQPGQSGNNTVSEPCASNSSCMIESVETGCSCGMNGNVLNGNVCSMALINVSMPTFGGNILPELSLPTFSSREKKRCTLLKRPCCIPPAKIS
jgi:actin-related protein